MPEKLLQVKPVLIDQRALSAAWREPMRQPPEKLPPKFKIGDRVNHYGRPGAWKVLNVVEMSEEWLVRTGDPAGYYTYDVESGTTKGTGVSENLLSFAIIEQLGKIADDQAG